MRNLLILMFITVLQVHAEDSYSQRTRLTLNLNDVTVEDVLNEIESKSEFYFLCNKKLVDVDRKVTLKTEDILIDNVLDEIFKGTDVEYVILDRQIVLTNKDNQILLMNEESKANTFRQQRQVSGRVTGANNEPLAGVTVMLKGTTTGTFTDSDGRFTLMTNSPEDIIVFSYIGYIPQEINLGSRTSVNVTLVEDVKELEEVVIVGYGTVKKSDLTGSVASLKGEDLHTGVQISVNQMIKGKTAGVMVNTVSSEPGGGVSIRIRGTNSISAGNEPLYVIDGLPISNDAAPASQLLSLQVDRNPLNSLNPGDIESIEILKDASATAIYGSRGANGVILITTKRGSGSLKVDYSTYFGTQQVAKKLDIMNAKEYMQFLNDVYTDRGTTLLYTQEQIDTAGVGTDWQDEVFRKASVINQQLSFSGSSGKTQYYASFNYLNQEGVVISSGIKQYTGRINLYHSDKKFNFGLNMNTSLVKDDFVVNGTGVNASSGVILSALEMDPTMSVYDEDGNYCLHPSMDVDNPVAIAKTWLEDMETNRTLGNFFAEYTLFDNLKAKINVGSDRQFARRDEYVTRNDTRRGQIANGQAYVREQERTSYLVESTLSYDKEIRDIHHINAVIGSTYQQFNGTSLSSSASDFPTDAYLANCLEAGNSINYKISSDKFKHQLLSYLGRVNYSLLDKYLLTASFRVDGSSRFGEDHKFGYFPSMALAWKMTEEPWIKDLNVISNMKLRTSYGVTGNQEIGNYQSLLLLSVAGQAVFNDNVYVGISPSQLGNPNLKWETTAQWDAGLDLGIFSDRITLSFDYFNKRTFDLLLNIPIPRTSGFTTSLQNVGNMKNTGFDFSITTRNLIGKFGWSTTITGATVKNKVINLGSLDQILTGSVRGCGEMTIIKEGLPLNSYYGYIVEGIFQTTEEIAASAQPTAKPGDLRYKDVSEDGTISSVDRTVLGDPYPDFSFGLDNTFNYKGFELNVFFEGMVGNQMLNVEAINAETPIESIRNRMSYVLDRWTPDNTDSENPSFNATSLTYAVNSRVVEDASYLRLKSMRLSYIVPYKKIRSLSVFATAQNLFTITNYRGYDPDVNAFGDSNVKVDYSTYPLCKIYTIGLNVGF